MKYHSYKQDENGSENYCHLQEFGHCKIITQTKQQNTHRIIKCALLNGNEKSKKKTSVPISFLFSLVNKNLFYLWNFISEIDYWTSEIDLLYKWNWFIAIVKLIHCNSAIDVLH